MALIKLSGSKQFNVKEGIPPRTGRAVLILSLLPLPRLVFGRILTIIEREKEIEQKKN